MNRLKKILFGALLSLAFLCAAPQKAQAQFVVSDPMGLAQQILDFFLQQTQEGGLFDGQISKLGEAAESFAALRDKLQDVQNVARMFNKGMEIYQTMDYLAKMVAQDIDLIKNMQYILENSNETGAVCAVQLGAIIRSMRASWDYILKGAESQIKNFQGLKRGDAQQMLDAVSQLTQYISSCYVTLRGMVMSCVHVVYSDYEVQMMRKADLRFMRQLYY